MPLSRDIMPLRSRRLLLLPLLLLVPLGVLKWRAEWIREHTPLSKMDVEFRAAIAQASRMQIHIEGPNITGNSEVAFDIKDKALMQELTSALRCKDGGESEPTKQPKSTIDIYVLKSERPRDNAHFTYLGYEQGSVLLSDSSSATVQGNFAPRFEAVIAQLAQRATSSGQHPGIRLAPTT